MGSRAKYKAIPYSTETICNVSLALLGSNVFSLFVGGIFE
jgi:hypothetical protein